MFAWAQARAECQAQDFELAWFDSKSQMTWAANTFRKDVFVGYTDITVEGTYVWGHNTKARLCVPCSHFASHMFFPQLALAQE